MPHADQMRNVSPPSTVTVEKAQFLDTLRKGTDWLDPINFLALKSAVSRKKPTVVLNGNVFNITYDIYIDLPVSGDRREVVKLKRADGAYAPFGYVSVDRLNRFKFDES